jgi:carbon-monoxide dehydrogenase medium subunit
LVGAVLDPERIGQAADLAAGAARPITDVRGGADYRTAMVRALVARCLGAAADA